MTIDDGNNDDDTVAVAAMPCMPWPLMVPMVAIAVIGARSSLGGGLRFNTDDELLDVVDNDTHDDDDDDDNNDWDNDDNGGDIGVDGAAVVAAVGTPIDNDDNDDGTAVGGGVDGVDVCNGNT